ncbi:UDP-glycosyltransferase 72D1 [Glycine max]|uniref:UDP-glycosyltransferase 72D1 n=1 Tax=Glycine max TaxID=3847 RepID=UPI001B357C0D|nr:UDP-glycosyltransferase 72D1 [Glycine max]
MANYTPNNEGKIGDVFEWLDKQEEEFVVYVSLGSGYTMSFVEMKEMALGLELSGNKFVWSVRPPVTKAGTGNYLTAGAPLGETGTTLGSNNEPSNSFPDEFYRIQTNGIVITEQMMNATMLMEEVGNAIRV